MSMVICSGCARAVDTDFHQGAEDIGLLLHQGGRAARKQPPKQHQAEAVLRWLDQRAQLQMRILFEQLRSMAAMNCAATSWPLCAVIS